MEGYLTKREVEFLKALKDCRTQAEVAEATRTSPSNVSRTIARAREKIIRSRDTVRFAKKNGYLALLKIE